MPYLVPAHPFRVRRAHLCGARWAKPPSVAYRCACLSTCTVSIWGSTCRDRLVPCHALSTAALGVCCVFLSFRFCICLRIQCYDFLLCFLLRPCANCLRARDVGTEGSVSRLTPPCSILCPLRWRSVWSHSFWFVWFPSFFLRTGLRAVIIPTLMRHGLLCEANHRCWLSE